ncbi:MAG: sugar phosphate isomerase/epimerase [Planctomycetota bacterium]|nr:sugar phosphate isomerase/epimerase [Planctomycetota bacterium]
MPGLRVGVQLTGLRLPFKEALHAAARMGADAIEIDARYEIKPSDLVGTALRQVRKLLEDLNLRVAAVRYPTRRGYECEDELERRIEGTKQAMKMAHDLGANVVVNQVGAIPESTDDPSFQLMRTVLSDLGAYSHRVGAFLGCETGAEPLSRLAMLLDSLPDGCLGITLNPGNLLVNGFDLENLQAIAKHVMLVHAKDGVKDKARGRGTEVPLGRGMAEFPEIVAILEEFHFPGYFVVERDNAQNPLEEIAIAVQFLKNI